MTLMVSVARAMPRVVSGGTEEGRPFEFDSVGCIRWYMHSQSRNVKCLDAHVLDVLGLSLPYHHLADKQGVEPLRFDWSCSREDGMPCFGSNGRGNILGSTWLIPAYTLISELSHTFTVTISKGNKLARPMWTS